MVAKRLDHETDWGEQEAQSGFDSCTGTPPHSRINVTSASAQPKVSFQRQTTLDSNVSLI
jgi:hypothetical protein